MPFAADLIYTEDGPGIQSDFKLHKEAVHWLLESIFSATPNSGQHIEFQAFTKQLSMTIEYKKNEAHWKNTKPTKPYFIRLVTYDHAGNNYRVLKEWKPLKTTKEDAYSWMLAEVQKAFDESKLSGDAISKLE